MDDAVTRALRACVVLVRNGADKNRTGTAFFVGPGHLLTCAHVVQKCRRAHVLIDGTWHRVRVQQPRLTEAADVAILRTSARSRAFARLGPLTATHHEVFGRGFPVRDGAPHEEQISGVVEQVDLQHASEPWKSGARLIKFKQGQVAGGFSGGPLYDMRTRRVVGIIAATRDSASDLGGIAIPVSILLRQCPAVQRMQKEIDWHRSIWRNPAGAADAFLERFLSPAAPFFGREPALEALGDWLAGGSSRGLVVANAGMGKSSLLARWFDKLTKSTEVLSGRLLVALVPVSISLQHCREDQVLDSLARVITGWQAGALADRTGGRTTLVRDGLAIPAPPGVQFLLLIDGLDEAVGWEFSGALFPTELGAGVRVLASARHTADCDAERWLQRLGWPAAQSPQLFQLDRFELEHVEDAVMHWWNASNSPHAQSLANELYVLTEGDPLVLGLYLVSLGRDELPSVERLRLLPTGLGGFFETWWKEQERNWIQQGAAAPPHSLAEQLFCLLGGAFEPLPRRGLLTLMREFGECKGTQLDEAILRLARFVIDIDGNFILSHPRIAALRWERLVRDEEAADIDDAFLRWCRKSVEAAIGSGTVEPYILRSFSRHLERRGQSAPQDWRLIGSDAWRQQHRRIADNSRDYLADLHRAWKAHRAANRLDIEAKRACASIAGLAEISFGRIAQRRLLRRSSPALVHAALRNRLWTPSAAMAHVLEAYEAKRDLGHALGRIAPLLDVPQLERAMAAMSMVSGSAFDFDDSLCSASLAKAAFESAAFDDQQLFEWASRLEGIGAVAAAAEIAGLRTGKDRQYWLEYACKALRTSTGSPWSRVRLALGKRLSAAFTLDELALACGETLSPGTLARWLRFESDDASMQAAALRMAWHWLPDAERNMRASAIVDDLCAWLVGEEARQHSVVDDFILRSGAIADVCGSDLARRAYRAMRSYLDEDGPCRETTLLSCLLRFAARLEVDERADSELESRFIDFAYLHSIHYPTVRDLYASLVALPEQLDLCGALVSRVRALGTTLAGDMAAAQLLAIVAEHLPQERLGQMLTSAADFGEGWRDHVLGLLLGANAQHSEWAARAALASAEAPDEGPEHALLECALQGPQVRSAERTRALARQTLQALPSKYGQREHLAAVVAPSLSPCSLFEAQAWTSELDSPSLGMIWWMPYVDAEELAKLAAQNPMKIGRAWQQGRHTDHFMELGVQRVRTVRDLDATLAWARSMDASSHIFEQGSLALAIAALAPQAPPEELDVLATTALALVGDTAECAEACASLINVGMDEARLWQVVLSALERAIAERRHHHISLVLRRLAGQALDRALRETSLLPRLMRRGSASHDLWIDCAVALLPWATEDLIDAEFMPRGELIKCYSGSEKDEIRAAMAPAFLRMGRREKGFRMYAYASGSQAWRADVAMFEQLQDAAEVERLVAICKEKTFTELALCSIARELSAGLLAWRPALVEAFCAAVMEQADSDAQLRLALAALTPLMKRLGEKRAVDGTLAA